MRVTYQSLTKTLSYGSTLVDKPKALLMAPTDVAAINIDSTTIYTDFNIPVGHFGGYLPPRSYKMKSSLRNRLSELKIIVIDEISLIFNNLLFYDHLRLNEIFGTVNDKPFAGISVITVRSTSWGEGLYMQIIKITGKILNHCGNYSKCLN